MTAKTIKLNSFRMTRLRDMMIEICEREGGDKREQLMALASTLARVIVQMPDPGQALVNAMRQLTATVEKEGNNTGLEISVAQIELTPGDCENPRCPVHGVKN